MKAINIQFDNELEEDDFYAITFWLDVDPPNYFSLAKDNYEDPMHIYLELLDQQYGFITNSASYKLNENLLTIYFDEIFEFLESKNEVNIEIDKSEVSEVSRKLKKIFDVSK